MLRITATLHCDTPSCEGVFRPPVSYHTGMSEEIIEWIRERAREQGWSSEAGGQLWQQFRADYCPKCTQLQKSQRKKSPPD